MKEYICDICDKNFYNQKSHYEAHLNKKKPCKKKHEPVLQSPPQNLQTPPQNIQENHILLEKENKIIPICIQIKEDINDNNNKYECEYCQANFVKKFNLTRHQNGRCKEKQNKDNEFKMMNQIKEQLDVLIKQNEELKKDNNKIKKDCEKFKKQLKTKKIPDSKINIVNNVVNNNNNIINNNQNIVNFNNMDYSNIDKKLFINPLLNMKLYGKEIILKMVENIYINETHPEYHNLIITDKNRGYVKIYNNGKWKTNDVGIINSVLDGIIEHSKTILDELFEIYANNSNAKSRLSTSNKYVKLCDLEYLADLEDEQEQDEINNKDKIKRCKDFREMVYKDTINLFHDNKNILLKAKNSKIIEI